jgi:branched-chain amino acid transport system substrate-binding protein
VPWAGIKFATSGDDIGQNILGSGLIAQYQKGKDGKMDMEIIYPFNLATANMLYPFPKF